jgi:hypothetical protein
MAAAGEDVLMGRYLALVLMALALAACGGGGGGGGARSLDPVANAAEKTAKQGSAKIDFRISGGDVHGTGHAVFNNDSSGSGRVSMEMEDGESIHMDMVVSDFVLYMRSPLFTSQPNFPEGKEWVRLDLKKVGRSLGVNFLSLESMSPKSAAAFLAGAGKTKKVGNETVQGVNTTRYHATVDLEKAADKASGSMAKTLRKLVELAGQKVVPVDVWIDRRGLLRKEVYSQRLAPGEQVAKITTLIYGFGAPISVDLPSDDKVVDITERVSE